MSSVESKQEQSVKKSKRSSHESSSVNSWTKKDTSSKSGNSTRQSSTKTNSQHSSGSFFESTKPQVRSIGVAVDKPIGTDRAMFEKTAKIIYRGVDQPAIYVLEKEGSFGSSLSMFCQFCLVAYTFAAFIYNIFNKDKKISMSIFYICVSELLIAMCLCVAVLQKSAKLRVINLLFHFIMWFTASSDIFIEFRTLNLPVKPSVFEVSFNSIAVSGVASAIHFINLMCAIEMIGNIKCDDYYEDKIIMESVQHRKRKVYKMVADLMETAAMTSKSTTMNLGIFNEQGENVGLNGSKVESTFTNSVGLQVQPESVALANIQTSKASVKVKRPEPVVQTKVINLQGAAVNDCVKQEKHINASVL